MLSLLTPDLSSSERRLEMERSAMRFISALTMESIINHISVLNPQRILKGSRTVSEPLNQHALPETEPPGDTTFSDPLLLHGRAYRD